MARHNREELDRFFDFNIFPSKRILYLGSMSFDGANQESGIDHESAESLVKGLTYLNTISDKPVIIIINSVGGDQSHGMAIYDIIKSSRCHVTMICLGNCCSMGSIILQAADLRVISPNCLFMVHDGQNTLDGHARNTEVWAEQSKKDRLKMYEIYYEKMKQKNKKITIRQIEKLCTLDNIFSSEEAIGVGLADEILKDINEYIKE